MEQGDTAQALQGASPTEGKMVEERGRKVEPRLLGLAQGIGDLKLYFEFIYYCSYLWRWTKLNFHLCNTQAV